MASTINDLNIQLEKMIFENKENLIAIDSLKQSRDGLEKELTLAKKQFSDHLASVEQVVVNDEEKEKKKQQRMELMMREFDPSVY